MIRLIQRLFTVDVPDESRGAFRREVPATIMRSVVQISVLGVGAQLLQHLGAGESAVAFLYTMPFLGLLASLPYVEFGKRFSPLTMVFWPEMIARSALVGTAVLGLLVGIGAWPTDWIPETDALAVLFAIVLSFGTVVAPFYGQIFGAIYPAEKRGHIISFGRMLQGAAAAVALVGLGYIFEQDPTLYPFVLPVLGGLGLAATVWFTSLPRIGSLANESERSASRRMKSTGLAFWAVLRHDTNFRRFQIFQFILGFANLMAAPLLQAYVFQKLQLPIWQAVLVVNTGVIMQAIVLLTVRFHGGLFDRIGVLGHRVLTTLIIGSGYVAWAFADGLPLAMLGAALIGFGMAGGQLVWTIGSLSFAPKHLEGVYTGIHTFLTGVRGAIGPSVSLLLLTAYTYQQIFLGVFGVMVLSAVGHLLFVKMPPREKDRQSSDPSAATSDPTAPSGSNSQRSAQPAPPTSS